jgi:hypothetical protein
MKNKSIALGFMRIANLTIDDAEEMAKQQLEDG